MILQQLLRPLGYLKLIFWLPATKDVDTVVAFAQSDLEFRGPKAWILVSAVLVASLGLNVNSAAVVIGAMLISPLMDPIIGIGLSIGIWDLALLQRSIRSLAVAVGVSVVVSTLFFALSPFTTAQSELIARTSPNLLDALIGIFGGMAGAIALVRQDRSNVVPGVAIATALMPPLCTAGFGLAHMDLQFFLGAFYLFFINSICISIATYAVVRLAKMPRREIVDARRSKSINRWMLVFLTVTLIPAAILSWNIFRKNLLEGRVDQLVNSLQRELPTTSVIVTRKVVEADTVDLEIALVGADAVVGIPSRIDSLRKALDLQHARIIVRHGGDAFAGRDAGQRTASDVLALYKQTTSVQTRQAFVIDSLRSIIVARNSADGSLLDVTKEARVLFPGIQSMTIAHDALRMERNKPLGKVLAVDIVWESKRGARESDRVRQWLVERLKDSTIYVRSSS